MVGCALCDAVEHCVVVEEVEGPIIAQIALPLAAKHHKLSRNSSFRNTLSMVCMGQVIRDNIKIFEHTSVGVFGYVYQIG